MAMLECSKCGSKFRLPNGTVDRRGKPFCELEYESALVGFAASKPKPQPSQTPRQ